MSAGKHKLKQLIRMATIQNTDGSKACDDVGQEKLSFIAGGPAKHLHLHLHIIVLLYSLWGGRSGSL